MCIYIHIQKISYLMFISKVAKVGVVKPSVVSTSCYLNRYINFALVTVNEYL